MIKKNIRNKLFLVLSVSILISFALGQGIVLAGDYYVDATLGTNDPSHGGSGGSGAWKTITYALSQASGSAGNPVTIHVAAGTYNTALGEGFPLVMKDYVSLQGAGEEQTIINAYNSTTPNYRVITSDSVNNYLIDGFTIEGVGCMFCMDVVGVYLNSSSPTISNLLINAYNPYGSFDGIRCINSSPTIKNFNISGWSGEGSGIYLDNSSPTIINYGTKDNHFFWQHGGSGISCVNNSNPSITNSNISNNSASSPLSIDLMPNGIYCSDSSPIITDCTISNNCRIGIVCVNSFPTISNCTISSNLNCMSYGGGGIYCTNSSPTINNCIIKDNGDSPFGFGGIECSNSSPTITNCIITNNVGSNGIVLNNSSSPSITNCLISNNWTFDGVIYCSSSSPVLDNCTIVGNHQHEDCHDPSAVLTTGIYCYNSSPTITNCILWNDKVQEEISVYNGNPVVTYSCIKGGFIGNGNISLDPLFVAGSLGNYYLSQISSGQSSDSPCVDAGSNTAQNLNLHDKVTRTDSIPDSGIVDMGYHYPIDSDSDGVSDDLDNCPYNYNPNQEDTDKDGIGDACQFDSDNDGICNPGMANPSCSGSDNCPIVFNPDQMDSDGDGIGDACDNCLERPNGPEKGTCITTGDIRNICMSNNDCGYGGICSMNQEDSDGDGKGDVCELIQDINAQNAVLNNGSISGDFTSTIDFTKFELVTINTGPFAGKGFLKGKWGTNLEGVDYNGVFQGIIISNSEEGKIYLKGSIEGDIAGTVEGYLSESTPGSGVYDKYQAKWKLGLVNNNVISANLDLNGTLVYQEHLEFPNTQLHFLQRNIAETISGDYNEPLSIFLTHISIGNKNNPYYGQGFSIISYISNSGSGEGFTYDRVTSPGLVELKGLFSDPMFGFATATLDERITSGNLFLSVKRVDLGLPPMADLKVKTWGPSRVSPGLKFSYILEIMNVGPKKSDELFVQKKLSPYVNFVNASPSFFYDRETHSVFARIEDLEPLSKENLFIKVEAIWGLAQGTIIEDPVCVKDSSQQKNVYYPGIIWPIGNLDRWRAREFYANQLDAKLRTSYLGTGIITGAIHTWLASKNYATVENYIGVREGDVQYNIGFSHSGGTQTLYKKIENPGPPTQVQPVNVDYAVFSSPALITQAMVENLVATGKVKKVIIFQSSRDILSQTKVAIYRDCFDVTGGELVGPCVIPIEVPDLPWNIDFFIKNQPFSLESFIEENGIDPNIIPSEGEVFWIGGASRSEQRLFNGDGNNIITITRDFPEFKDDDYSLKIHSELNKLMVQFYVNGYPPFDGSIEDLKKSECPEEQSSEFNSVIAVGYDPNIKYGPEGNVSAGQKLNYRIEYANEGEGIAFGVYFTDVLNEDLDASTLELGPVISTVNGSVIANPGTYNSSTRTITWLVGEVGPGEGGYADISVNVKSDAPDCTEIINYATVYFPSVPEETRTNGIVSIVSCDSGGDGIYDDEDNCPNVANSNQTNSDNDSHGDACDNCPLVDNEYQADIDLDGRGDACDNCPNDPNTDQIDSDNDGMGDICDNCPNDPENDKDGDGFCGDVDNCSESNLEETIIVDGCDSGVENQLFDSGCTMSDLIIKCAKGATNHGGFVSCVSHLTNQWKKDDLISGKDKGAIQSCAAKAKIP